MIELDTVTILAAYFSTLKVVVTLVLLLPWLYAVTWMNKDTSRVHTVGPFWCGLTLAMGVAGVLALLLVPYFAVGVAVYLLLAGGVIGTYVVYRNKRVVPEARVLTADHIKAVWSRQSRQTVAVVHHVKLYDIDGKAVGTPAEEESDARQAYNAAQELLHDVVMLRASEVDLAPSGPQTAVRFVIDGVVNRRPAMDRQRSDLVIDFIKQIGGMKVDDKRRPQNGTISLDMGAVRSDIKVTAAGTTHGQRLQMRILQEAVQTRIEELGMPDSLRERIVEINVADNGLIIVSGPRRSGVTSTLYSLLRRHDAFMKQLATMEKTVDVDLENVTQHTYDGPDDLASKLGSVLRRDPDVVMVDACQGPQAAQAIYTGAESKNILLGVTADNTFVALAKWVKVCGNKKKALAQLKAVLCQKLLRKLCTNCREAYRPAREMLTKLNLPAEKIDRFYRPPTKPLVDEKGKPMVCPACHGTAYLGRTAAFELLELNDEIRQLIIEGAPLNRIKAACRKNGMLYLQEQALRKVIEGITSVEEVIRVSKSK